MISVTDPTTSLVEVSMRLLLAGLLFFSAPAIYAQDGVLAELTGQVLVTPPGTRSEVEGRAGMEIPGGSKVKTGKDSSALVLFKNGSELRLRANSSIRLSGAKREQQKGSVMQFFGSVWNKVTPDSERTYEVRTANAVCGVRGTEFETTVGDDGSVRVQVKAGEVGVGEDAPDKSVAAGQQLEGNEQGLGSAAAQSQQSTEDWRANKQERLFADNRQIVDRMKDKIMNRKDLLESLRAKQKALETRRAQAAERAKNGDPGAKAEVAEINQQLATMADAIVDLGEQAESQFGLVDHFSDLAKDPRFKLIDRQHLEQQAKSLRAIKAMFDKMVKEGTDLTQEGMNKVMEDMKQGPGSLFDGEGSSADELFR
jgi:hypothetical protein